MKSRINLVNYLKYGAISFLLALSAILIGYEIFDNIQTFNLHVKKLKANYIENKKNAVKQEVTNVINRIRFHYRNKKMITEADKKAILTDISNIRFGTDGYIFVNTMDGNALVSNGKILSGEKKLWDVFSKNPKKTKEIFQKEYEAANTANGDFIYYSFVRISDTTRTFPKTSYIAGIPSLNWLIGAGVYLDGIDAEIAEMKEDLQQHIISKLLSLSFAVLGVLVLFILFFSQISKKLERDILQFNHWFKRAAIENKPIDIDNLRFTHLEELAISANKMVSDKHEAEKQLIREREQLLVTIRSIGDGLITTDKDGNIELMNSVSETLTGWTLEEAKGKPLTEVFNIINALTKEPAINPVKHVLEKGKIVGMANHTVLIAKDGTEYQIADSAAPILDTNGQISGVVMVFRDVTQEYKIQSDLKKSEEQYRFLVQQPRQMAYDHNLTTGKIQWVGDIQGVTGYTPEEMEQFDISQWRDHIHHEDRDESQAAIDEALKTQARYTITCRFKRKDGSYCFVENTGAFFVDDHFKTTHMLGIIKDVSEQKIAEEKLIQSEKSYRGLFDSITSAVYIQDKNGVFIDVNHGVVEMYGYPKEFFIGNTPDVLAAPNKNDLQKIQEYAKLAFEGSPQQFEFWGKRKNGEIFPKLVRLQKGHYFGKDVIIVLASDITEIKESEFKYKALVENAIFPVVIHNLEGKVLYANSRTMETLKASKPKDILGAHIEKFLHPDYLEEAKQAITKIFEEETDFQGKQVFLRLDGQHIDVEVHGKKTVFDNTPAVQITFKDITQQNKAEKALKENEERFKRLSELTYEGILIHKHGIAIDMNLTMAKIFGYEVHELMGKNLIEMLVLKESYDLVSDKIKKTVALPYEVIGIRKNGEQFPLEIEGAVIGEPEEGLRVAAFRDISQKKLLMLDLVRAKEKAEESDMLKTEFIHNLSHEIRTPMNGILGFSNFLKKPNLSEETRARYIEIIQSSGEQLLRIIDDILEISRLETKQVQVVEKAISINDFLSKIHSVFAMKAQENQLTLTLITDLPDDNCTLYTDDVKLGKILHNLLENAIKFTMKGGIKLGYTVQDKWIEFFVQDTGVGIHNKNHAMIFGRFSQEEKEMSRSVGGIGLGLSIANENAKILGGKIRLDSEKGKGSTFFVTIPFKQSQTENNTEQ